MEMKSAIKWVIFWIGLAVAFNIGIYFWEGPDKAMEFLGGYLIELSLSLDNLFLFITLFAAFGVKGHAQRRVLNYGIIGAIILRLIFIMAGVAVVNKFHWVLYVFGAILLISGLKMMFMKEEEPDLVNSKILKGLRKMVRMTDEYHGELFMVKIDGLKYFTPLFAVVVLIEFTDVLFAIDSIPAVFAISRDPLIVYTSNIFAIMGLRSLYFVLGALYEKFTFLKYGIATLLMFTGVKLTILMFDLHISTPVSIGVIALIISASIVVSLILSNRKERKGKVAQNIKL